MAKTEYKWSRGAPPAPDVYTTRRNQSAYRTLRYWDGERWFEIAYSGSRGGIPFKWPRPSRSKKPGPASWSSQKQYDFALRRIHQHQDAIEWGEPFKVYDEKEVLAYLVKSGRLIKGWRTAYQEEMRRFARKGKE